MKIITGTLSIGELNQIAADTFMNMVKAVVDVERKIIAVDAELHSDLEALLLDDGSKQENLWGINFYPQMPGDDFVEFDSMINMRPSQKNMSRGIENEEIRKKIIEIVEKSITR